MDSVLKCTKCDIVLSEKCIEARLCDGCNVGLMAQNLAAELSQHQVKRESSLDRDVKIKETDEKCDKKEESEKKVEVKIEPMTTRAKTNQMNQLNNPVLEVKVEKEQPPTVEPEPVDDDIDEEEDLKGPMLRRMTRKMIADIEKYKHPIFEPSQNRSRRSKMFKSRQVYKAPTSQARIYSSDYVFHKGRYFQIGDVVACTDATRPGVFYAQITSFLTDQYCHKCATLQWLFPTQQSPNPSIAFDPRTYFLGFLDEMPRPLDCLVPVMRCPSDYYTFDRDPFPSPYIYPREKPFLSQRVGPVLIEAFLEAEPFLF